MESKYWNLIAKYYSGQISREEKEDLLLWINKRTDNKAIFEQAQEIWDISGENAEKFNPDIGNALDKFKSNIEKEELKTYEPGSIQPIQKNPGVKWQWLKIAAILVFFIGTSYLFKTTFFDDKKLVELHTAANEKLAFYLPDSSQISLNRNSELSFPPDFNKKERIVYLKGEGFFEVKKDNNKPFIIYTQNTKIEVLGTSFNVNAYEKNDNIQIVVASGRVAFSGSESSKNDRVILESNDKGNYDKHSQTIIKQKNEDPNFIAWKNKKIIFSQTELEKVILTIRDYFGIQIKIANQDLSSCRFTGTFDNPDLNEVLEIITVSMNLSYKIEGGEYILFGQGCK